MLKRAGDEWEEHSGSIYCGVDFGENLATAFIPGNGAPKPFEYLDVSVVRAADIPADERLPKDLCTHHGYAHIGECGPLQGVGDYAFYIKTLGFPKVYTSNGIRYREIPGEGVRSVSGSYEIKVLANNWKGGNPRLGIIELAKKLAANYH